MAASVHKQRGEIGDSAESAEIEAARRGLAGGSGAEFVALEAVVRLESVDLAAARRQSGQAAERGDPDIAACGAEDVADHVARQAVGLGILPYLAGDFVHAEEAVVRAEPLGPVGTAPDAVDTGRRVAVGRERIGDDALFCRIVAPGPVVGAYPEQAVRVQVQGADPSVLVADLLGRDPARSGVDNGHPGPVGSHVNKVPRRVITEGADAVGADPFLVGERPDRAAGIHVEQARVVRANPDGAVFVAGQAHNGIVGQRGILDGVFPLRSAPVERLPEDAGAVRGHPEILSVLINGCDAGAVFARDASAAATHIREAEHGLGGNHHAVLVNAQPDVSLSVDGAVGGAPAADVLPDGGQRRVAHFLAVRVEQQQAAVLVAEQEGPSFAG